MANKEKKYQTLAEVHEAFSQWELNGQAYNFAFNLWKTAEYLVYKTSTAHLTDEYLVGSTLYHSGSLTKCLTDDFRRLIVRYHARGVSTTTAIESILLDDTYANITPFYLLRHDNVCGYENIKDFLVGRLSYLKPSHPRWPEKKYGDLWREERSAFVDTIGDIPLTQPVEQLQELSEHYIELKGLYRRARSAADKERYHKCMMRSLAGIHQLTQVPVYKSLSKPQTHEKEPGALPKSDQEDIIDIPSHSVSRGE